MSRNRCHHGHTAVHLLLQQPGGKGSHFLWFGFLSLPTALFMGTGALQEDISKPVDARQKAVSLETLHGKAQPTLLMRNLIVLGCPELFHVLLWERSARNSEVLIGILITKMCFC